MTIHWDEMLTFYNEKYGTSYSGLKELFVDLYKQGNGLARIAEIMGVSVKSVEVNFNKFGIKKRRPGQKATSESRQQIIDFIQENDMQQYHYDDIAKIFGAKKDAIKYLVRKNGKKCKRKPKEKYFGDWSRA